MNRLFLYSGFLFILILIFDAYDRDYNQAQIENSRSNNGQSFDQNAKQPPKGDVQNDIPVEDDEIRQEDIRSIEHQKLLTTLGISTGLHDSCNACHSDIQCGPCHEHVFYWPPSYV